MAHLKKLYNLRANSLIESVMSMSIISICLFIAVIIYATVFTSKSSVNYYNTLQETDEAFFLLEINQDSLTERFETEGWEIEEENISLIKKIVVNKNDGDVRFPEKTFYILHE
jgi:competence protein ComGF